MLPKYRVHVKCRSCGQSYWTDAKRTGRMPKQCKYCHSPNLKYLGKHQVQK
jgi:Zn finger protein HypA/HybF involved in hydrogenase expression